MTKFINKKNATFSIYSEDSECFCDNHQFQLSLIIENTCRLPDPCPSSGPCRNELELSDLEAIAGPCDKCYCDGGGRPLDIDVHCNGIIRPVDEDFPPTTETYTLWFDPRGLAALPVVNNIIYDTSVLNASLDIVRVITTSTTSEMRQWVCKNLRFVTVIDYSKIRTDTDNAVISNWPYNDLYWAYDPCEDYFSRYPNDVPINLVPC